MRIRLKDYKNSQPNKSKRKMKKKELLWKEWSYHFKEWMEKLQSAPIELIKSKDKSGSYEMNRRHIFKLENKKYAVIIERGCSCYSDSDAEIELFPNIKEAKKSFLKTEEWQEENWNN